MSIATTTRIMEATDARLRAARDDDEVRRIGIEHVQALGSDLATTAYLKLVAEPDYSVDKHASFLQETIGRMLTSIEETFVSNGVRDVALLADHLEAAEVGFVGRLDELFSVVRIGGQA